MTVWPVIQHELQKSARRGEAWVPRHKAALWLIAAMLFLHVIPAWGGIMPSFSVASIVFLYCLVAGAHQTVDALSVERRENTLPFLFLTRLSGFEIVLAKLAALGWRPACALLAFLPFLAVETIAGAIRPESAWRLCPFLFNVLFFSLAAGLFCSSFCRRSQSAAAWAVCVILFFLIGMPLIASAMSPTNLLPPSIERALFWASPGFGLTTLEALPGAGRNSDYAGSLLAVHAAGWGLLLAAGWRLARSWQDQPAPATLSLKQRLRQWRYGRAAAREAHRRTLLKVNPFFWLAARDRFGPFRVWLFLGIVASGLVLFQVSTPGVVSGAWLLTGFFVLCWIVIQSWLASAATETLFRERESGALEFLLCTSITVQEIMRGQWLALHRKFAGPVVLVALSGIAGALWLGRALEGEGWSGASTIVLWLGAMLAVLLCANSIALVWCGMWKGMKGKTQKDAANSAFSTIVLLPVLLVLILLLSDLWFQSMDALPSRPFNPLLYLAAWFVLSLLTVVIAGASARKNLLRQIRRLASEKRDVAARD
jgi:ABC-type transport system involved in multi-copper enzyme maturation permease subunit